LSADPAAKAAEEAAADGDGEGEEETGKAVRVPIAGMTGTVSNRCS
jgi:hypothetical protein